MSLKSLIQELSKDRPKLFVDIVDENTGAFLYRKIDKDFMLSNADSIKKWFLKLVDFHDDLNSILIHKFLKNGTSWKRNPLTQQIIFKKEENKEERQPKIKNNVIADQRVSLPPQPTQFPQPTGLLGSMGLSGMDIVGLAANKMDYDRLKQHLDSTLDDVQRLKRHNDALEIELRKTKAELSIADKIKEVEIKEVENTQKSIAESPLVAEIAKNIPHILEFMKGKGVEATSSGLAGTDNLPDWKKEFINVIINDDSINHEMVTMLYFSIKGMLEQKDFKNMYYELLEMHNLYKKPIQEPLRKVN